MIYFLVNNNYHLDLDYKIARELHYKELGLIQIPYSLNIVNSNPFFSKIHCFNYKVDISIRNFLLDFGHLIKIHKKIDQELIVNRKDVLFVHTDIVLLNQYIISKFQKVGAKIFLLEDGTATMCIYNLTPKRPPFKERIKEFFLRNFYGYKNTSIVSFGAQILPMMKDHVFNGVIVNYGNSILRKIALYKLKLNEEQISNLNPRGAIFFSQPLYYWYLKDYEYISYLEELLKFSNNFDKFYFKFHPSEDKKVEEGIRKMILKKYSRISIIEENEIAENLIHSYPVKYAITFNSTAAMNLVSKGVIPIFLNGLLNSRFADKSFSSFDYFLKTIKCNCPLSEDEVKPGFVAFTSEEQNLSKKSINEILKLHSIC
jgi:hypothetical protein